MLPPGSTLGLVIPIYIDVGAISCCSMIMNFDGSNLLDTRKSGSTIVGSSVNGVLGAIYKGSSGPMHLTVIRPPVVSSQLFLSTKFIRIRQRTPILFHPPFTATECVSRPHAFATLLNKTTSPLLSYFILGRYGNFFENYVGLDGKPGQLACSFP